MSLLQSAETWLGPINPLPSIILNELFFESPIFWTTMALINFFYGNDIPCCMAVQQFHACNDNSDALMSEQCFYFYYVWQNSEDVVHLVIYFNMRVKKVSSSMVLVKISSKLMSFKTVIYLEALETMIQRPYRTNRTNSY